MSHAGCIYIYMHVLHISCNMRGFVMHVALMLHEKLQAYNVHTMV